RRVAQYAIALTTRIPYTYTLSLHDALPILYLPSKTKDMERTIQPDIPYISGINIANGALLKCGNGRVCIVADASPFTALLKGINSEKRGMNHVDAQDHIHLLRNILEWLSRP